MNPHDDLQDQPQDDEQFTFIMKSSQADAPPPDPDFLARLRAESTEAFAAASSQPSPRTARKPSMLARHSRWLKAAAAVLIVGVGVYFWLASRSNQALGQALDNLEKAQTLHVRISAGGNDQVEIWYEGPSKRWRWDDLDGKGNSRIVDGDAMWAVNEKENMARRVARPAHDDQRVLEKMLNLLELTEGEYAISRNALPVERQRIGDQNVLIYRSELHHVDVPGQGPATTSLEARVDADSNRLIYIGTFFENAGKKESLRELTVLAYNEPIAAEKFAVADTLTEDGRIGSVVDVQGLVTIKPVLGERWTPMRERLVLRPGDWLRTDARGANAAAVRLVKHTDVILGPKTLVEFTSPKQLTLTYGDIEIDTGNASIELLGPGREKVTVKGRQMFRIRNERLTQLAKEPPWLLGFKGATANEALGSLVALVDGRNVPLTVGYHKVSVDIRDQIARTVIEESFVNHTKDVLEGVFYFPLPPDASISGFGMWIGDKLIEADVVEKQRAREIYETFKREKRDPGLLEWSGGNIFKARVYPIPAHAEKRIKITYTQVLPLKGNRYRYSYALMSELLRQHPLRQLDIDVKINSALPLRSVSSPTHKTRNDLTQHSAHVEFTDQEYVPTRDFEVVVEVENRPGDVVMIPHRRGDDGYFMLQLTPPGPDGNWERPLLPSGDPLHLLILADTSASIDAGQRANQAAFIGALLSSLSPQDTFNLAGCDVGCAWVFAQSEPAEAKNVERAREFLEKRAYLGWTDLGAAFASALKRSNPATHVIYVGDGVPTTGDADPIEFTKRLRRLYPRQGGTFHAVALGSSFEPAVLKTIASLGSGSLRKITGEQGPAVVARELLAEIAQPGLRDLKVEFKGIRAARVNPDTLVNIPAGTQQILLGRYLPEEGGDQNGEVIVSGTQGSKPVRFSTKVSLKDAESGNSFVPRLWARMYLDSLLDQGSAPIPHQPEAPARIRDEIISLSEEFNIITPYTSLLVLETDADRERFKVKRRFQMRDGQRFFEEGHENAVFELAQKQKKKAGAWRTGMRRAVLQDLTGLGRQTQMFQARTQREKAVLGALTSSLALDQAGVNAALGFDTLKGEQWFNLPPSDKGLPLIDGFAADNKVNVLNLGVLPLSSSLQDETRLGDEEGHSERGPRTPQADPWKSYEYLNELARPTTGQYLPDGSDEAPDGEPPLGDGEYNYYLSYGLTATNTTVHERGFKGNKRLKMLRGEEREATSSLYASFLDTLLPPLSRPAARSREPKSTWPAPARELAKSLLRTEQLTKWKDAVEIARTTETFDVRWAEITSQAKRFELAGGGSWLTRSESGDGDTIVAWCDAKDIGVYSRAFQLGQVRASRPLDQTSPPLMLGDFSLTSLERIYADYVPTLQPQGNEKTLLILKNPYQPLRETRILIDTARHVVLAVEQRTKDKVSETTRYGDFVERAGSWWASKIETTDADGKRTGLITQTIQTRSLKELAETMQAEQAQRADVQLLYQPLPSVLEAKKAVAANKANFEHQFVLMLHFLQSEQWQRVFEHLRRAEELSGKPGMRWVRNALLAVSPRREELRLRLTEEAKRLAVRKPAEGYFLAGHIYYQAVSSLEANEMLALLDELKPLYEKQPPYVRAMKSWQQMRLANLNQPDKAMLLRQQLAAEYPRDYHLQIDYAQALADTGEYAKAYAWLTGVLVKEAKWYDYEEASLRNTYAGFLQRQGRYGDLAKYLGEWVERNPPTQSAYEQYLAVLFKTEQEDRAEALMTKWLKDAQVPGELPAAAEARLLAATSLMLCDSGYLRFNRIEERWLPQLVNVALFFARSETYGYVVDNIMSHYLVPRSEPGRKFRKTIAGILTAEFDKLPAAQIERFVGLLLRTDDVEQTAVDKVASGLRERWTKESAGLDKQILGEVIVRLLERRDTSDELLTFLRLEWQKAPERRRAEFAAKLFERLLQEPYSAAIETEALSMLDKLSTADEAGIRLFTSVAALHRLTDKLLDARIAAHSNKLDHPEKLTRTELLQKRNAIRLSAHEGLADRLRQEAGKQAKTLAPWLLAESLYLDLQIDRRLKESAEEIRQFLGIAPAATVRDPDIEPEIALQRFLDDVLRQRYLVMAANLAARKGADPVLAERLLKYVDRGIAADPEDGRWKLAKVRLLTALDRGQELERTLQQWTRDDDADSRWRITLGYLFAEQGKLHEAIQQLEIVEKADELGPSAYASLAEWYLVQNRREEHERAALAVFKTMPERQLGRMIQGRLYAGRHVPTALDKDVLRMFAVLLEKSGSPQSYLGQLQQFYQASRDFRLLAVLPDAVLGHTVEQIYPFVRAMKPILDEVRDEATADDMVKRIGEVRARAKSDVDRRALDLFEAQVESRAAELQNQSGTHLARAAKALQAANKRAWAPGEMGLMADYLAGLGKMPQQLLVETQLRQLKNLLAGTRNGTLARLQIAQQYARALHLYGRGTEAVDQLQAALDEFAAPLPVETNPPLAALIGDLEAAGHFVRAEKILLAQIEHPVHAEQRRWLIEQLDATYRRALEKGGEVSLGKGLGLYRALKARIRKNLDDVDENHRDRLLSLQREVFVTAHKLKLPGVADDVRSFAFKVLPPLLSQMVDQRQNVVSRTAQMLHDLAGPRDGIVFLVDEIDREPRWLRDTQASGWSRHGSTLAKWRTEADDLGDAEARLLKLVLAELRRDLETRERSARLMYSEQSHFFWKAKAGDFAKTAEDVLAQHKQSGPMVQYVADYFFLGLKEPKRAIEILQAGQKEKLLDEAGEASLVDFLQHEKRYAESIPLLQPLVERRPEYMGYAVQLMHAYYRTGQKAELLALLKKTDAFFHEKERWGEEPLSRLSQSTLENELFERSVSYDKELISLHERTSPKRGIGDGTLSGYYGGLARAYAGLKQTDNAVDAAGAAIVAWGNSSKNRAEAHKALKEVLRGSADLDAFTAKFDARTEDSAVIRKALGEVYLDKKEYRKAIEQLDKAARLQPGDAEVYEKLLSCFDKLGDKQGAVLQLLQAVQTSPRDLKLYQDLGERFTALGQNAEAERAYTSIVEMLPTEAESHTLLAEIREKQDRWAEAIDLWKTVVKLRALEPTGLLKLAAAQIHEKQTVEAQQTIDTLNRTTWPERFVDVHKQIRSLEERLAKLRKE